MSKPVTHSPLPGEGGQAAGRREHNVLLSIEFEEGALAHYVEILRGRSKLGSVGSVPCRQFELELAEGRVIEYNLLVALGAEDAVNMARTLETEGQELVAGIFELPRMEGSGYAEAIQQIRQTFPRITCAVIAPYSEEAFESIRHLFKSPDEWLYFDSESVSGPELEQTIRNLITTYTIHREREEALETLRSGKEGLRAILQGTPDLLQSQTPAELHQAIVEQGRALGGGIGACLGLLDKRGRVTLAATSGGPSNRSNFDVEVVMRLKRVLEEGQVILEPEGAGLPLVIQGRTLGVLHVDRDSSLNGGDEILEVFASQAAFALDLLRRFERDRRTQAMESELQIASQIQSRLVPRSFPDFPGLEIDGYMRSAREIGGDYFDIIPVDRPDARELFVTIGDVAGKGVPAGLMMSEMRACLRALVRTHRNPRSILRELGPLLHEDLRVSRGKFISLLVLRFTAGEPKMVFSSAGHEHILHYRADSGSCRAYRSGGIVVGTPLDYYQNGLQSRGVTLQSGDVLLLFTDGVTEALSPAGELFGLDRLVERFSVHARDDVKHLLPALREDLDRFLGSGEPRDDVTMVAIRATR